MRWPTLYSLLLTIQIVAAATSLAAEGEAEQLRMYDLTDLIEPVQDFPSPLILRDDQRSATPTVAQSSSAERQEAFLRQNFDSSTIDQIRAHTRMLGTTLFVTAPTALQDRISARLSWLRQQRSLTIRTHLQLLLMGPTVRQGIRALSGLAWRNLPGCPGQSVAELDDRKWSAFLEELKDIEFSIEQPAVTSYSGQLANITTFTASTLAKLRATANGSGVKPGEVQLGTCYSLRATAAEDHHGIRLVLDHIRVTETKPFPFAEGPDLDGTHATAGELVPWIAKEHLDQTLRDGQRLIIATGLYCDRTGPPLNGFLIVECAIVDQEKEAQLLKAMKAAAKVEAAAAKAEEQHEVPPPAIKGSNDF
jgi:hypothetical protein